MNFSSLPKCFLSIVSLWCFGLSVVAQEDDPKTTEPPFSQPPKLEQAFEDDFSIDSRANYEIEGDVKWEKGKLSLGEGSVLQRKLDGSGPWIEIDLELEFPKLTKDGESSELKIWLDLDYVTDSLVLFRQDRKDGKTKSTISIVDSDGNWDANPQTVPVREPRVSDSSLPGGNWSLGYRNGLWQVRQSNRTVLTAHIDNGIAYPTAIVVQAASSKTHIKRLSLEKSKSMSPEHKEIEESELDRLDQFEDQMGEHYQHGNYGDAAKIAEKAADLHKILFGEFHPASAKSINNFAYFTQKMGAYEKAVALYLQAKMVKEKVYGIKHPEYAFTLNNLVGVNTTLGNYKLAEQYCFEAKDIRDALGKDHPDYANSLSYQAVLYKWMGDYEKAEPLYLAGIEFDKKVLDSDDPDYAMSLNNLAAFYEIAGDYEKAEPQYLEAKNIFQKTLGKEHPKYANVLGNLSLLYLSMREYTKAEQLALEAKRIREKVLGKTHRKYALSLNNLGTIYHAMGDYEKAEPMFLDAKGIREKVLGKGSPAYATSLNNLGAVYRNIRDFEKAEPILLEAIQIREKALGKEHRFYALSLINLASLYQLMGRYEEAERLVLEAEKIERKVLGEQHPDYATTLNGLADLYKLMEKHEKAERLYRDSLSIIQSNFERFAAIQTESQQLEYQDKFQSSLSGFLTVTQKLNNDPTNAFELLMNWKGQIQLRQSTVRSIQFDKDNAQLFSDYRSVSQQLFKHLENDPANPKWTERLNNLASAKESIEKELAAKSANFAQTKEQITLKQIQDSLPARAVFVNFHQYYHSEHVDDQLVLQERLLGFVLHATGKVKLIDLGESDSIFQALQDWRTIFDPASDTLANQKKAELAADVLRKRLWQPAEQHFEKRVTTVLISPDGELGTLPFTALPGKNSDSYLVNEYQIATIPVPRLLTEIAKRKSNGRENPKALLVGDVDYASSVKSTDDATQMVAARWRGMNDVLQGDWAQLAQTGLEVEQIRDLLVSTETTKLDSIQLLKQKQASEFLFRDIALNFNILHIATHGFFADPKFETIDTTDQLKNEGRLGRSNRQNESAKYYNLRHPGILSGLVFAGANKKNEAPGADDGIMTADEISVLQLKDVDLVTLSACETGLGKSAGGEGLIGIQRAFQISGARTTVASLWKVDDLATRKLMERFYRNMFEKKMGKLAALTEAQRWLLNNPKEHSDIVRGKRKLTTDKSKIKSGNLKSLPARYWAAWILAGDWR